jgi:ubiquinone/menaquinone biosynthesis C-methylase UbiE
MLPDLAIRSGIAELMDNPDCAEDLLLRTVRQFASINRLVARYRTILKRWVLADMCKEPGKPYHLVDMGAGGCDIDVWLLKAARKRGLDLRITACDLDPRIIQYARSKYGHVAGLTIRQVDLLAGRFDEPVDFVFANHFLHHLPNNDIVDLIRLWQPQVRRRMVFSDLERDRLSYLGYSALSLFYRKSFARYDGLVSIRRGFRAGELESLAREALREGPSRAHRLAPGRLALCIEGNWPENT